MDRAHRALVRLTSALVAVALACAGAAACSEDQGVRKRNYLESGNRYFEGGRYREAVVEYRNALEVDSSFGPAHARLAETYERLGNSADAFVEYVRAADTLPDDLLIQLKAGNYLLAARRIEEALAKADAVIAREPGNVDAHILRGNALGGLDDFDNALKSIEEAIRIDPSRGATYAQLGVAESARGRTAEAEAAFKRAVELSPKAPEVRLALGNFYWAAGRIPEAQEEFRASLVLDPKHPGANRAMAALAMVSGHTDEAERYLVQLTDPARPDSWFLLTDYYVLTNRSAAAVQRLEQLASKYPGRVDVEERLARAHASAGNVGRASELIDAVIRRNGGNASAKVFKGQLLAEAGQTGEALTLVRSAADADPGSIAANFVLGQLYAKQGDRAEAERAFKNVLKVNPHAAAAQVELARLELAAGRAGESLRFAEEAARNLPESLDVRLALVRSLLASGDLIRAERDIAALLKEHPQVAAVHVQQGILAAEHRNRDGARSSFATALSLDPASLEALAALTMLDLSSNDIAAAKARIDRRLTEGRRTPEVLILAGRTYAAANDLPGAERHLLDAIRLDANVQTAYVLLAHVYMAQGRLDNARREFDALAQRQSRPVSALTMSGLILQSQGDLAGARARFERVLALDPDAAVAANNLAWMHLQTGGNLDDALQLAQRAVASMPDAPEMLDTLGWVYYKKGLPALAVPPLTRSVERQPDSPVYHYHLGVAQLEAGNQAAGRRALEQALRLKKDFDGADDARRRLGR